MVSLIGVAAIGLGWGAYAIFAGAPPRWAIALGTVLGIVGVAASFTLALLLWYWWTEWLRPRIVFASPKTPSAVATRDAALIGQANFRWHPLRWWGGLIFRNRLFIGVMLLGDVERLNFRDPTHHSHKGEM